MASTRRSIDQGSKPGPRRPPAKTLEDREYQLIALAVSQAEEQLRNGTASSQVVTHYLKLGSGRERLEREKLREEVELLRKKSESLDSAQRMETLYADAIAAMRSYSGQDISEEDL